jgi:hypothetical protein
LGADHGVVRRRRPVRYSTDDRETESAVVGVSAII